jgi:hypothetical protein
VVEVSGTKKYEFVQCDAHSQSTTKRGERLPQPKEKYEGFVTTVSSCKVFVVLKSSGMQQKYLLLPSNLYSLGTRELED